MQNNLAYYLAFSHFLGIGPMRFAALIERFGTVIGAYHAHPSQLGEILGSVLSERFDAFRNTFRSEEKIQELRDKKIIVVTQEDNYYPFSLKYIADPPICLYVKGEREILKDIFDVSQTARDSGSVKQYIFAVVGTRKPTSYGEQIACKFASELARCGIVIVSGMAIGIDAIAHEAALQEKGKTIAVLGCGVDIVYPPHNKKLYERIIEGGGLVISEFPPGHTVLPGLFVARNRLISGLSHGILVVEGAKDSGSLITARFAAEQGKEVFAPPAPLTSLMSEAPNMLLKEGARLVTSVDDILEGLNITVSPRQKQRIHEALNREERVIFEILVQEPQTPDDIAQRLNVPIASILNTLSVLEIKGIVEKNKEGKHQVKI